MKSWPLPFLGLVLLLGCAGDTGPQGPAGPGGADWPGPPPQGYLDANGLAGGAAYSQWWTTQAGGSGTQPTTSVSSEFYRCKTCHAWDGMGTAGSYANRTGQSTLRPTRPDVSSVNLRSAAASESYQELFDLIVHKGSRAIDASDNRHPDFSPHLSDAQVWNLIKFMKEEWVDPNLLYDLEVSGPMMYVNYTVNPPVVVAPTLTYSNVGALGSEANGQSIYSAKCAGCHGANGTRLEMEGMSLGQFVRQKPHEAWFKTKFGEPGTGMEPGLVTKTSDLQDLYRALANPANFPNLP